jgi:hypothetical protein
MLPLSLILGSPIARYALAGIAFSAVLGGGYLFIHHRGVADCERDHNLALVESIQRASAQAREIALQDAEVLNDVVSVVEKIRIVYREREQGVKDAVPLDCRQCSLSPSGLGLLNESLSNSPGATENSGNVPPRMPGTIPNPGWQFPGGGREIGGYSRQIL